MAAVYAHRYLYGRQEEVYVFEEKESCVLLGKLLGKKTCLSMDHVLDAWDLEDGVVTESLGDGFFLFSFGSKSDMIKAWSRGTVYGEGECLLVRKWCPGVQLDIKIMSYVQVWIQLPDLDLDLDLDGQGREEAVHIIASSAGQPIAVDFSGGGGGGDDVIRVCIEVDVNQPLVSGVEVDDGDGGFWQSFRCEVSGFCFDCGRLDHKREHCPHHSRRRNRGSTLNNSTYGSHNLAPRREEQYKRQAPVHYFSWHRPAAGWVKLNFDGSFKGRTGRAGGGGVLRGADGSFIAAFAAPLETSSALMAEIGALQNGLRLALKLNVKRISIEGDSKITVEMLTGKREPKGEEESSVMSYTRQLLEGFEETTARHEFREANRSADHLANMAAEAADASMEWHHHPPHSLLPFLLHDQLTMVVPRLIL